MTIYVDLLRTDVSVYLLLVSTTTFISITCDVTIVNIFFPTNHTHSIHTWIRSRFIFDDVWNFHLTNVTFLQETLKCFLLSLKVWTHLRQQQQFRQQHGNEVQWARRFYVQIRSLKELDDLVRELKLRLSREGIDASKESSPWDKNELALVLKVTST